MNILNQGDPLWRKTKMGATTSTIGQVGCLLTVYAQLQRFFGVRDIDATPLLVNDAAIKAGAYRRASLVQPTIAEALGLVAGDVTRPPQPWVKMQEVLRESFEAGVPCILHVDHDSDHTNGDWDGDHFILATHFETVRAKTLDGSISVVDLVVCADPNGGREVRINFASLTGERGYKVRSVRPVRKAA